MKQAFNQARGAFSGAFDEDIISDTAWNKFQSEVLALNPDFNKQDQGGAVYKKVMGFFCENARFLKENALIPGSSSEPLLYGISDIFEYMKVKPKSGGEKFGAGGIQKEIIEFRDKNGYGFAHQLFEAGRLDVIFTGAGNAKFPLNKDELDAFLDAGTGAAKAPHPYALIQKGNEGKFAAYLAEYKNINLQEALNSISVKSNDNSFLSSLYHGICEPVYNFIKEKWNSLTELIGRIFKDGGKER